MAQVKNSKKEEILSAICSFLEFAGKVIKCMSIGCGVIAFLFIILPIWWVLDILFVLTSPIWFSILIWWDNKKAAEVLNIPQKPDKTNFFEEFCDICGLPFQNWCYTVWMKKMWQPVVKRLPISYRVYFI